MRTITLAVTAILLLLPLDLARAGQVEALLDLGEMQLRRRDWDAAKGYFEKAMEASPGDIYAHVGYQEAVLRSGNTEGLQARYDDYHTKHAESPDAAFLLARLLEPEPALKVLKKAPRPTFFVHLGMARALSALDKKGDAASEVASAEEKCPKDPRAIGLLAGYFEDQGNPDRASKLFSMALEIAPKRIDAMVGLADCQRKMKAYDKALKTIEAAATAEPEDPEVLYRKGLVLLDKGEGVHAAQNFGAAIALAPKAVDVILAWGDAFLLQDKAGEAEDKYEIALKLEPNRIDALRRIAYAQEIQDKNDDALKNYEALARIAPLDVGCRVAIGWIYIKKGKFDQALRELKQASDSAPNEPDPLFLIGYAYDQMGRWAEAADAYEKAVKRDPTHAWAWNNLGLDQNYLGKTRNSIRSFEKAVEIDPENVEFRLNHGFALYDGKKYKDAVDAFSKAVELDPKLKPAWVGLAMAHKKTKNYKAAAEAYEEAIKLDPKDIDLNLMAGILYEEDLDNPVKALEHYDAYIKGGGTDPNVPRWIEELQKKVK